jgi:hypothetical protein
MDRSCDKRVNPKEWIWRTWSARWKVGKEGGREGGRQGMRHGGREGRVGNRNEKSI